MLAPVLTGDVLAFRSSVHPHRAVQFCGASSLNDDPLTVTGPSVRLLNESGEPQRKVKAVTGAAKLIVPVFAKPAAVLSTE